MNITVLGVGKVGENLVKQFVKDGHDVVVIDTKGSEVERLVNYYDVMGTVGSGLEKETLVSSGVAFCNVFIACTSYDEVNILACILAKKLGAKHTIARVRNPELYSQVDTMKNEFGLDLAFNPEYRTSTAISHILKFPSANSVESFAGGRAIMVSFTIEEGNSLIGKSLVEIASYGYKMLFAIVVRGEQTLIPKGNFVIEEGDEVHIIAKETELIAFCKKIKIFKPRAKSVFIVGGGRVSYYLAKELTKNGVSVKIMELDKNRAEQLADELSGVSILCGDATDQSLLEEESLRNSDALVALTGTDETNVIISMYAKSRKVDKVVTKINKEAVSDMVKHMGLDTIISPKEVIASYIIKFIRACGVNKGDNINALYRLHDNVEALEFTATSDCEFLGVALKDLKVKKDLLIGGIVRDGEYILPSGESQIIEGDRVIVVASLNTVTQLADIVK